MPGPGGHEAEARGKGGAAKRRAAPSCASGTYCGQRARTPVPDWGALGHFRAPHPSPSTGTAGAHSCHPCSCGGPGRPVGRAGGGGRRVPGRRGGAQLGHIWPERGGTKWNRRLPFIPRGAGRPYFHLANRRPEDFGGTNTPTLVRESRKLARGWNLVLVPSRWSLAYPPVTQVAKRLLDINNSCPGPSAQVHSGAAPVTRPAPSHTEEARLREGKCTVRKQGRPLRDD